MTTKLVPPAPRCCQTKTEPADEIPGPDPSGACPAAAVAAAYHGVCAAMPLDLLPSGRNPIIFGTAVGNPRLPHARFLPPLIMLRDLALPSKPKKGAYGWRPRGLSWNVQTCFPSFPIAPISCCLHNLPSEVECVRQTKTKTNAVRLRNPHPLRMARMPTITLPSQGFACRTPKMTSSPRHHLRDPPPSQ